MLFEAIALWLLFNSNNFHKSSFLNSSNSFIGSTLLWKSDLNDFFSLREENEKLVRENARLRASLKDNFSEGSSGLSVIDDSLVFSQYHYLVGKVIHGSTHRTTNFFTINKGAAHGIKEEMGVMSSNGLVGFIKDVSRHFSTIVPIINVRFASQVKLKKNNHTGLLSWDGKEYEFAQVKNISKHVLLEIGDTVVTGTYSGMFPENVLVGVIHRIDNDLESDFKQIKVKLSTDFDKLNYVYLVDYKSKLEREELEKRMLENVK